MEENNDNLFDTFKTFVRAACVCGAIYSFVHSVLSD